MSTHRSRLSLAGLCLAAAFLVTGLSACTLYLGPDDDYGDDDWCDDDWSNCGGDDVGPPPNGFPCDSDLECAAGCYCSDAIPGDGVWGTCIETGYCTQDSDCGSGLVCDDGTCKPEGRGCDSDEECPDGTVCEEAYRVCVPDPSCDSDAECPSGSVCNEETRACEPTQGCTADGQCPDGQYCDEDRGTCVPGVDPEAPTCAGTVTCNQGAPRCPAGQVPLIDPTTGCYTGTCEAIGECDAAPVCGAIQDEPTCRGREDCEAAYTGLNCRMPNGAACQAGVPGCVCEEYRFSFCATE
jgi:Cys-rich repeat protein